MADAIHSVPRRVFAPQRGAFIVRSLLWMDPMTRARTGVKIQPVRPPAPFENGPHNARARIAPEIQPSESL